MQPSLTVSRMLEFLAANQTMLWWMSITSILMFIGTLIAVPWLVVKIPSDYFSEKKRHHTLWQEHHPVMRLILLGLKNLMGTVFVLLGIIMLVIPGQGILTIVIGIVLLDFPGKFRLLTWCVKQPPVLRSINWFRLRANHPPLIIPESMREQN